MSSALLIDAVRRFLLASENVTVREDRDPETGELYIRFCPGDVVRSDKRTWLEEFRKSYWNLGAALLEAEKEPPAAGVPSSECRVLSAEPGRREIAVRVLEGIVSNNDLNDVSEYADQYTTTAVTLVDQLLYKLEASRAAQAAATGPKDQEVFGFQGAPSVAEF